MDRLNQILSQFGLKKILVVGDSFLDTFTEGDVKKICHEAPVQIVEVNKQYHQLGGAADVAVNIVSLEGKVALFSFAGNDSEGQILRNILDETNAEYFLGNSNHTLNRSRILVKGQQLLRLDKGNNGQKGFEPDLREQLLRKAREADIIVVSDHASGVVNERLMRDLEPYTEKMIVDPRPEHRQLYRGVLLLTPNEEEICAMTGCADVFGASKKLSAELKTNVLVARGKSGMFLFSDEAIEIPTTAREVYDLIGAGETVSATLSLAISSGASIREAAVLANYAAGITIQKKGNYAVTRQEISEAIFAENKKIKGLDELERIVLDLRIKGKSIVWTNGCYDLIHTGHLESLRCARELGDVLIVGVTCDEAVRMEKGPDRPIHSEKDRAEILASMGFIDYITVYSPNGAKECIARLKPDVYVKGGDYSLDKINQEERRIVGSYGGRIVLSSKIEGKSTTGTVGRIKKV